MTKDIEASADPAADPALVGALRHLVYRHHNFVEPLRLQAAAAIERLLRERDDARSRLTAQVIAPRTDTLTVQSTAAEWMAAGYHLHAVGTISAILERADKAEAERDAALRERDDLMRRLNKENGGV